MIETRVKVFPSDEGGKRQAQNNLKKEEGERMSPFCYSWPPNPSLVLQGGKGQERRNGVKGEAKRCTSCLFSDWD